MTPRDTFHWRRTEEPPGRPNIGWLGLLIVLYRAPRWSAAVWPASPLLLGCLQLVVMHLQKLVLPDLITAPLIVGLHRLSGDRIHELLPKAIACLLVDLSKRNPLARGDGRV
jgi:hypothetical protein